MRMKTGELLEHIKRILKDANGESFGGYTFHLDKITTKADELRSLFADGLNYVYAVGKNIKNEGGGDEVYIKQRALIRIDRDVLVRIAKLTNKNVKLRKIDAKQLYYYLEMAEIGEAVLNSL